MRRSRLIAMAAVLVSAHPPPGPTRDDLQRCYFITHPNQHRLPLNHWPIPDTGRNRYL